MEKKDMVLRIVS